MGMLCAAGLCTMRDLLDVYGPWDYELVETMLPVAIEHEIRQTELIFRGVHAAIVASIGKNGMQSVEREKDRMLAIVRDAQREVRGLPPLGSLPGAVDDADRFIKGMAEHLKIGPGQRRGPRIPRKVLDAHKGRGRG